jgi:hypothetical protein
MTGEFKEVPWRTRGHAVAQLRFVLMTSLYIKIMVLFDVNPCSLVYRYRGSEGTRKLLMCEGVKV